MHRSTEYKREYNLTNVQRKNSMLWCEISFKKTKLRSIEEWEDMEGGFY